MDCSKYNLEYQQINFHGKPLFLFVNHRVSLICWNKIKKDFGKCDVVTLDSHRDFRGGFIFRLNPEETWGSKYNKYKHRPFEDCKEFVNWDLFNEEQNNQFMKKGEIFLTTLNDNFIDVAFMKNVINDVFWYYVNTENNTYNAMCDDLEGNIHKYSSGKITSFKIPKNNFILDLDLDFFVDSTNYPKILILKSIQKYFDLISRIIKNKNCIGITIALEPGCCGSENNCLTILGGLSNSFGINLREKVEYNNS